MSQCRSTSLQLFAEVATDYAASKTPAETLKQTDDLSPGAMTSKKRKSTGDTKSTEAVFKPMQTADVLIPLEASASNRALLPAMHELQRLSRHGRAPQCLHQIHVLWSTAVLQQSSLGQQARGLQAHHSQNDLVSRPFRHS